MTTFTTFHFLPKAAFFFLWCLLNHYTSIGQCNNTTQYPSVAIEIPTTDAAWHISSYCSYPGEYMVFNVTAGWTYHFSTCAFDGALIGQDYDTQLTLRMQNGTFLAYSDDLTDCGTKSRIVWTANFTGQVNLHINKYNCQSDGNIGCTYIAYKGIIGCITGVQYPTTVLNPSNIWQVATTCQYGGEYGVYNVTSGNHYIWTTCGNNNPADYDTQLTLTDINNNAISYSDDDCDGNKSWIEWNANFSGQVRLHFTYYNCQSTNNCSTVSYYGNEPTYEVVVNANPSGGGSAAGGGTYNWNSTVTVTATPNAGWTFTSWTAADGTVVSTNPTYTFTLYGDASFNANFTPTTFQVTTTPLPAEGGTTTGDGYFSPGTTTTLTATPNPGWTFAGWYWANIFYSADPNYSIVVNAPIDWVAQFAPVANYNVTVNANPVAGGTVTGGGTFSSGTAITVNATPNAGWNFTGWQVNDVTVATTPGYTFTLTGNTSLTASFSQITYDVTLTASPAIGGTVTGGGTFGSGASVTVNATPSAGWNFTGWQVNGVTVSTTPDYTFPLTGNITLTAVFTENTTTTGNISDDGIVKVSPNPTTGLITFDLSGCNHLPVQVEIFTVQGVRIGSHRLFDKMQLDISTYSGGIYYLRFEDESGRTRFVYRLVKL